jgi:REP-associated tyrosine transposase
MTIDRDAHHRRSIRLRGYDYSQPGAYFVTVCVQNRECLFGEVASGEMHMNDRGQMVESVWDELPTHYAGVDLDALVVVPNHAHGIVVLIRDEAPTLSLPDVMQRFKSLSTTRYVRPTSDKTLPI